MPRHVTASQAYAILSMALIDSLANADLNIQYVVTRATHQRNVRALVTASPGTVD